MESATSNLPEAVKWRITQGPERGRPGITLLGQHINVMSRAILEERGPVKDSGRTWSHFEWLLDSVRDDCPN